MDNEAVQELADQYAGVISKALGTALNDAKKELIMVGKNDLAAEVWKYYNTADIWAKLSPLASITIHIIGNREYYMYATYSGIDNEPRYGITIYIALDGGNDGYSFSVDEHDNDTFFDCQKVPQVVIKIMDILLDDHRDEIDYQLLFPSLMKLFYDSPLLFNVQGAAIVDDYKAKEEALNDEKRELEEIKLKHTLEHEAIIKSLTQDKQKADLEYAKIKDDLIKEYEQKTALLEEIKLRHVREHEEIIKLLKEAGQKAGLEYAKLKDDLIKEYEQKTTLLEEERREFESIRDVYGDVQCQLEQITYERERLKINKQKLQAALCQVRADQKQLESDKEAFKKYKQESEAAADLSEITFD